MRSTFAIVLAALLLTAIDAEGVSTRKIKIWKDSRFFFRLEGGGSMHPSDQTFETLRYVSGPDYSIYYDRETMMMYHFDQKFGGSVFGAVGVSVSRTIDCEVGFGYEKYAVGKIGQDSRRFAKRTEDPPNVVWTVNYPDAEDAKFSAFVVRPAVMFAPSRRGTFVPSIGAGFDVKILSGSGSLVFEMPETAVGDDSPDMAILEYDGSEVLLGIDLSSALDIRLAQSFALRFDVSYLFMERAFKNFHEHVTDEDLAREFESIGYSFEGISFSGLRAAAGIVWYP